MYEDKSAVESLYEYHRSTEQSAGIVFWKHQGQDYKRQSDAGLSN